ncbi:MAG: hypothetical protein PVJ09_05055 [Candidatus Woesebacteria bacterium]|jgi:hypothetical protein
MRKFNLNRFIVNYFFFCFFFFTFFASGMVDSQDGFQYLTIARRMYYDHTFEMPIEGSPNNNLAMNSRPGKDGKIYSMTGLAYSLAFIPAVIIEDFFLKLANQKPLSGFPLQSDWPILLVASMTNAFFGALLVVTLYQYLRSFAISHKQSIFLSFIAMLSTNLFVYTKHVYPHMMFTSFLTLAFYFIRLHSLRNKKIKNKLLKAKYLFFAGLSYGVVIITYNPTFIFSALPLILYYLLLEKQKFNLKKIKLNIKILKQIIIDAFYALLGILPFCLIYFYFNIIRFGSAIYTGYDASLTISKFPAPYVIFEGIWGVLFSPGRSIFVYSPILLMLIFFWWKLKKNLSPEIVSFFLLTLIYVYFIGTNKGGPNFLVWHGEMSWGNRYMVAILPFLFILIAKIYQNLSRYNKYLVFFPLVIVGLYVQLLGIFLPYQLKRGALPADVFINEVNLNYGEYPNFIPRYSAIFKMSKIMLKRLIKLRSIYDHGDYNLRLYDGYDSPLNLGWTKIRELMPNAYMSFDDNNKNKIRDLSLQFKNYQMEQTSTYSAQISFNLNNHDLVESTIVVPANENRKINLQLSEEKFKNKNNILRIDTHYIGTSSARLKDKQIVSLENMQINDLSQNIDTLNYPYVSPISASLYGTEYHYWGNKEQDPWEIWRVHSRIFEQTFDLWWLRPFHYWDLPKNLFFVLFILNLIGIGFFARKIYTTTLFNKS